MEELKIINKEQTNPFYDESKSNDGGGYYQPRYEFQFGDWKGVYDNTSCGDFGSRWSIDVKNGTQEFSANLQTMDGYSLSSDFPSKFPAEGFYEAFEKHFGFTIPTEEDVQDEWDDED
ncbi:MAG: hypothetical protein ACFNTU_06500, partial [Catonella sp.]